jgi:thiamine-phosphate pyrophosphorylase
LVIFFKKEPLPFLPPPYKKNQMAHDCRLYLITPHHLPPGFADTLAEALDAGDVAALQLRLKGTDDDAICRAVDQLRPVAHARDVALILNDRPDLAVQTGCDGAHVGAEDMKVPDARKMLGKALQLGVSCYDSRDLALRAGEAEADYVAFGAFFPSPTKTTGHVADLELLSWWSELMEPPVVAIGGITAENCAPLVRAGANFLAVVSAVWAHAGGPAAGIRALNAAIAAA